MESKRGRVGRNRTLNYVKMELLALTSHPMFKEAETKTQEELVVDILVQYSWLLNDDEVEDLYRTFGKIDRLTEQ